MERGKARKDTISLWTHDFQKGQLTERMMGLENHCYATVLVINTGSVNCLPQCGWASYNPLRVWIEEKAEEGRMGSLLACFSWDIALLPLNWDFTPLASLVVRPLVLDWNYTTGFPGPPACWWYMVGLNLHNCMSQFLIINLSI